MKDKHKIAIISDTHGLFRTEMIKILETCEAAIHAGDIGCEAELDALDGIVPVYAVRGNTDKWLDHLPLELHITLFGFQFYIVHDRKNIPRNLTGIDVIVYGHSHKYEERHEDGRLLLNPGSCGPRRFRLPVTMAVLEVDEKEHKMEVQRIDLLQNDVTIENMPASERDMRKLIASVLDEMKAGRSIEKIASRHHAERELVEQICRIYVTHPGVTVQGILDKMEVSALVMKRTT